MELKKRLQEKQIKFKQSTKSQEEIWICCPFCDSRGESQDTRFRLGVNVRTGTAHCFNCEWKSRKALGILQRELELGHISATTQYYDSEAARTTIELPLDFEQLSGTDKETWFKRAKKYVTDRGITEEQIKRYNIGFSMVGRYAYRIIFPVKEGKQLVGLVARSFVNKEPRYLNTVGLKSIYGIHKRQGQKQIILSEGVFKSLAIERVINTNKYLSASLLGSNITDRQEELLDGFREIILWPDPDIAGIKGIAKIVEKLGTRFKIKLPFPMPHKQADELVSDEIAYMLSCAEPYSHGLIQQYLHAAVHTKRFG